MEIFTLTKGFLPDTTIDVFDSVIWTERYYGDSEVQLSVPATHEYLDILVPGTFLGFKDSREVMILEPYNIKNNVLKVSGISILKWLNNRFVRYTAAHEDRHANIEGFPAGQTMWKILNDMCISGAYPAGVADPTAFIIPGLGLKSYDVSGSPITVAVAYGPVYDALLTIATTYQIGMSITLESANETSYSLGFLTYKGLNRASNQTDYPIVRFSPHMDSLTDIEEFQSIAGYKTRAYVWVPPNPDGLASTPGFATISESGVTGFDMRAVMIFADDITTDMVGGNPATLNNMLNQRAVETLQDHAYVRHVDGEIVPTSQFHYGRDYFLGDVVEVQGYSNAVQRARVTEYIRSQDSAGEKAYPTLTMIE